MLPNVNILRAKHGDFMAIHEARGISGVLAAIGAWDELTLTLAAKLIGMDHGAPVIVDIGANLGTFSIPIAKHITDRNGVVFCFEPQRLVYYQLCGNIFLNRLDNVHALNYAISDEDKDELIAPLDFSKASNIGGYSVEGGLDGQPRCAALETCKFARLDTLLMDQKVSLLKVDVEGMELKVFSGAKEFLRKNLFPSILFESWDDDPNAGLARALLEALGYELKRYAEHDYLAQHSTRQIRL